MHQLLSPCLILLITFEVKIESSMTAFSSLLNFVISWSMAQSACNVISVHMSLREHCPLGAADQRSFCYLLSLCDVLLQELSV